MSGGSLYQGVASPQERVRNLEQLYQQTGYQADPRSLAADPEMSKYMGMSPGERADADKGYRSAMDSPGGQDLNKSASSQMGPIDDKLWGMVNANNPNSQFVLDEQRKRYAALTDPNNPELRRAASLAGESAMAAARRSGIRGGYGIQAGEGAFNKAYQDQYLQRQQMAQLVRLRPEELRFHLNIPAGAGLLVRDVVAGSRAEALGIRRFDILLKLDGELIDTPAQLKRLHEAKGALDLLRRGEMKRIDLAAESR